MLKSIAIIPARYASTRFPAKPLIDLGGMSMIQRVYTQARQCKLFDEVIVATDDQRIYDHVSLFGKVMMTSDTHKNGTERCAEILEKLDTKYDIVINVQGDEPFIDPHIFEPLILSFQNKNVQIATLCNHFEDESEVPQPSVIKVCRDINDFALYFSRSIIPYKREPIEIDYYKHIGIYAFRTDVLLQVVQLPSAQLEQAESLEQLRWLYNGFKIKVLETEYESISIDTPLDIDKLKAKGWI